MFPSDFNPLGIYASFGPNWTNDLETICANLPDRCPALSAFPADSAKAISLKENGHYAQNFEAGVFAEYVDNFSVENNVVGKAYDLESIS